MAPRVNYVGSREVDGVPWHDYTDEGGKTFSVPDFNAASGRAEPQPMTPPHSDKWRRGLELELNASDDVKDFTRQEHNARAAASQPAEGEMGATLPENLWGVTNVTYPESPDHRQYSNEVPQIPMPFGTRLQPFDDLYPGGDPTSTVLIHPDAPADTMGHEQLHVDNVSPGERRGNPEDRARFNALGMQDRIVYARHKIAQNAPPENHHVRHTEEQAQAARQERFNSALNELIRKLGK